MACETRLRTRYGRQQTLVERKQEVKQTVTDVNSLIATGRVKVIVDKKTGAIAFVGLNAEQRNDVTDACVYRMLQTTGSTLTKLAIAKAEQLAGRPVNKQALAAGVHTHDGGASWGSH